MKASQNLYYRWSKEFLEAGKNSLTVDTMREVNGNKFTALGNENKQLRAREAPSVRVLPIPGSQI